MIKSSRSRLSGRPDGYNTQETPKCPIMFIELPAKGRDRTKDRDHLSICMSIVPSIK